MGRKDIKKLIKEAYGLAAIEVETGVSCCSETGGVSGKCDPITSGIYKTSQIANVPDEAFQASLGCGNPTALAQLEPGETVLDLGSGGGIDVFLAAQSVGVSGMVYGLDMTDEMLALARENQRKAGIKNVVFLKGEIEAIPLPDNAVDVIISNCVINLSADKDRVFSEAFRVLRPGGRLAVSDIVVSGEVPEDILQSVELWVGCVAGALEEKVYHKKLEHAGFTAVEVEPTRIYSIEDFREFLVYDGIDVDNIGPGKDSRFMSAFFRAYKPASD